MTPFLDAQVNLREVHTLINHPDLNGAFALRRRVSEEEVADYFTRTIDVAFCTVRNERGESAGFFLARWINPFCVKLSGAFLPGYRGKFALDASKQIINYLFSGSVVKIVGEVSVRNHKSLIHAIALGFHREGVNRGSLLEDGEIVDQIYVGLTRGDWKYGRPVRQ